MELWNDFINIFEGMNIFCFKKILVGRNISTPTQNTNIYHIEFGKAKSNVMKIGKKGEDISMSLGSMEMDYTNKYKYLGLIQNTKNNLEEQIKGIRGKVEVAYQTILAIATDQTLINLEMETIWKNIETCIIPIITYSGEVWNPTKTEWKEINRILEP